MGIFNIKIFQMACCMPNDGHEKTALSGFFVLVKQQLNVANKEGFFYFIRIFLQYQVIFSLDADGFSFVTLASASSALLRDIQAVTQAAHCA